MSDTIAKLRELLLNQSKAGRLRSLLDSIYGAASTGAEAYGSASSPMSAEHSGLLGGLLMDMSPLGDAKSAYDGVQSAREGDWLGAGLGGLGALPMVPNLAGIIGKHHTDTLSRLSKGVPDDVVDKTFGVSGHAYYTPMRPFENAQANSLGVKTTPIAERAFKSDAPLTAKQLAGIEAIPLSDDSIRSFAKELSDEGLFAMMHKDGKRFTVVMPSTKNKGFQMTEYDPKGAIGDRQTNTPEDAIQRMIEAGYSKYMDEGMASRLMNKVMLK